MNIKYASDFFKSYFGVDSNATKSTSHGRPHSRSSNIFADPRFPSHLEPAGTSFKDGHRSASAGGHTRQENRGGSGPQFRLQTPSTRKTNHRSQSPASTYAGRGAWAPKAPAKTPVQNLLRQFSIRDLDAMTDKHWQSTLAILGIPHTTAMLSAPLASNWRRFRSEFNAVDAGKLLLGNMHSVVEILLQPPKSRASPTGAVQPVRAADHTLF